MPTIVLDQPLAEKLRACKESTTLRDADGRVIGFFEPPPRIYAAGEIPEFDDDELDRREARHEVLSSAEVRRRLGISR